MQKFSILVLTAGITLAITLPSCSLQQKKATQKDGAEITVTGLADHSKAGAIVIAGDKTYFIEGKSTWDSDGLYQQKVEVTGKLKIVTTTEKDLKNEKGEYMQGMAGETLYLVNARWKKMK